MGAEVTRVNGPLVETTGMRGTAMNDVVELGPARLPGEIVALEGDAATVQAYEYTGGLAPGAAAATTGRALSAPLGAHLLGGVFDGLLRPLSGAGVWLDPSARAPRADADRAEYWPVRRPRPYSERLDAGAPCTPASASSTCSSPCPSAGRSPSPAASARARRCCSSRSPSGATPT
ncbi:hypothetical protein ACFQY7_07935 [Actinomadura luteofluorescens]|uniref:hypothetical protein n=1 Tax=Actinomadura luteofluorescens TaxID=46163 RepID=UPI0036273FE2